MESPTKKYPNLFKITIRAEIGALALGGRKNTNTL